MSIRRTLSLSTEINTHLDQLASEDGVTPSALVSVLIRTEADRRKKESVYLAAKEARAKGGSPTGTRPVGRPGMSEKEKWGKERAKNIHQWLKDQWSMWGRENQELYDRDYKPYTEWLDLMERQRNYSAIYDFWETHPFQGPNRTKSLAFVREQLAQFNNPS
jgi:hypothetical protein